VRTPAWICLCAAILAHGLWNIALVRSTVQGALAHQIRCASCKCAVDLQPPGLCPTYNMHQCTSHHPVQFFSCMQLGQTPVLRCSQYASSAYVSDLIRSPEIRCTHLALAVLSSVKRWHLPQRTAFSVGGCTYKSRNTRSSDTPSSAEIITLQKDTSQERQTHIYFPTCPLQ
jgi:hypothetical protein